MRFTFNKQEKLKSRKLIKLLFEDGKKIKKYPLLLLFLKVEDDFEHPIKAGFSVPKRNFKRAVDRNKIKRLLRENYRLKKPELYKQLNENYILMFIYQGNEILDYHTISEKMSDLLAMFLEKNNKN